MPEIEEIPQLFGESLIAPMFGAGRFHTLLNASPPPTLATAFMASSADASTPPRPTPARTKGACPVRGTPLGTGW